MAKIIYAKDFGIFPDRYMNSLNAINDMISSLDGEEEEIVIKFEKGRYILSHEEAREVGINISNTTSEKESRGKMRKVGVLIEEKHNITFDGCGAYFAVNGEMIIMMVEKSRNITFKDFAVDYVRPTMTEMTIDKSTMTSLECTINKGSEYKIEDDKIVFTGSNFEVKKPYYTLIYDRENNRTYKSSYSPIKSALSVSEIEPYKVKFTSTPRTTVEKIYEGLTFEVRNNIKSAVGVLIDKSRDIKFEGVSFHYMHGLGIVGQLSKNLTFDNIVCAPRVETMRHNASFSDMMHFAMCNGKIAITNSKFSGAGADAINIHGSYLIIKQRISDRRILLEFVHPATYGIDVFKEGDELEAIDVHTHAMQWVNKVKAVKVVNKTQVIVDLTTPFDGIKVGQAVENVTKTPAVEIVSNTFDNIPAKAILVTTRRKVEIKRNTFDKVASSVISIAGDTSTWYESGRTMDVTIEKNVFNRCGFDDGKAVISVVPKNLIPSIKSAIHKNINVIDNTFILDKTSALQAKCTENIRLANNRYEGEHGGKPLYKFTTCSNISLENEDYTTGYDKMSCLIMDKKKEVKII